MHHPIQEIRTLALLVAAVATSASQPSEDSLRVAPDTAFSEVHVSEPASADSARYTAISPITYGYSRADLLAFPFRGTQQYLSTMPAIATQDGQLHVRGGREGELGYFVDGIGITNRFTNAQAITVIPEAMERIRLLPGVAPAEFGGANSGFVLTQLRTGGDHWEFSADYRTDDFAKPGNTFLGTSSFGYRNAVVTAGGPVPEVAEARVFLAAQHSFMRNRQAMFLSLSGFQLVGDRFNPSGAGQPFPGAVSFKENSLPNNWAETNTVQGTVLYDLHPFTLKLIGSYEHHAEPDGSQWPDALTRVFNQRRNPVTRMNTGFLGLQATHTLSRTMSYDLSVSYYKQASRLYDPDFGTDWHSFTDSVKNAALGYTGFVNRWTGPQMYTTVDAFGLNNESAPNRRFTKNSQVSWSFAGSFSMRPIQNWSLKVGGRAESWTMRFFEVRSITNVMTRLYGSSGNQQAIFLSENDRRVAVAKAGAVNNYGFDVDGNAVDGGRDSPRRPVFAAGYLQNDFKAENFTLSAGLRYEYYDTDDNYMSSFEDFDYFNNDVIDETKLHHKSPAQFLLPRIALEYHAGERTSLYSAYGMSAGMPAFNHLYIGTVALSRYVLGGSSRGFSPTIPAGFYARPERMRMFDLGIRHRFSDRLLISAELYQKEMSELLTVREALHDLGVPYFDSYLNGDRATAKGVELAVEYQRTDGIAARLWYSLSDVRGTGSTPDDSRQALYFNPALGMDGAFAPLTFNQTHRATLLFDYLNPDQEGSDLLSGTGATLVLTFNSGHRFTRTDEDYSRPGIWDEWTAGAAQFEDFRWRLPLEPTNGSTTPLFLNIDLGLSKRFLVGDVGLTVYVDVLNVFNAKQVVNVYPATGSSSDDGWFSNTASGQYLATPNYENFYRAINLQNRWAYMQATGNDIYGSPRQIRLGLRAEL